MINGEDPRSLRLTVSEFWPLPASVHILMELCPLKDLSNLFDPNVTNDHYEFLNIFHHYVFMYLLRFLSLSDNKVFSVWGDNSVWEKCSVTVRRFWIDFWWPISYMKFWKDMSQTLFINEFEKLAEKIIIITRKSILQEQLLGLSISFPFQSSCQFQHC